MKYPSERTDLKVLEDLVPKSMVCPLCGGKVFVTNYGSRFSGSPFIDVYFGYKCSECLSDFNATGKLCYEHSKKPTLIIDGKNITTYHNVNGVQCEGEIKFSPFSRRLF